MPRKDDSRCLPDPGYKFSEALRVHGRCKSKSVDGSQDSRQGSARETPERDEMAPECKIAAAALTVKMSANDGQDAKCQIQSHVDPESEEEWDGGGRTTSSRARHAMVEKERKFV
ncbi:hypothetical protein B0H16DRAFT_1464012 [Mycena metata]|uniref:Uncharacterized protein n=1 Tax=Mycena metata TaxID=1033252 RepID=A0AAD7IGN5_9AGAR|nr:hypothetical protein B0H16DRAFT_1464012 [Mycena metata]